MSDLDNKRSINRRDLVKSASIGIGAIALGAGVASAAVEAGSIPALWDYEVDVVVIGAGAVGLPAAIVAREAGKSVIVVEAEKDIGGHAITSGGNIPLGGGTSVQKKYGILDLSLIHI